MDESARSDDNYDSNYDNAENRSVAREKMDVSQETHVAPKKKKRVSKTAELETKINALEERFDKKLDRFFDFLLKQSSTAVSGGAVTTAVSDSQPGGIATQHEPNEVDNDSSGVRRPLISLDPNLDEDLGSPRISRNVDIDARSEISIQPTRREKTDLLGLCSDNDESDNASNHSKSPKVTSQTVFRKTERFSRFLNDVQASQSCTNNSTVSKPDSNQNQSDSNNNDAKKSNKIDVLSKFFKNDITSESDKGQGLQLDTSQVTVLENSWRTKYPERLSSFKEEYRSCFPLNDNAIEFLQVPSLDDILEPMIKAQHGVKAVKNWDKQKQLFSQPLKQVERLAYQSQMASRMGIISVLYLQNALASLMFRLGNENVSDETCQSVNDIFSISMKSLDQFGRAGAFGHMIRRKAAASDSGLNTLGDLQSKVLYLPLTSEGVFGKGLEDKLEKRKEQREQLVELLPELSKRKSDRHDSWPNKTQRVSYNTNSNNTNRNSDNFRGGQFNKSSTKFTPRVSQKDSYKSKDDKKDKDKKAGSQSGSWGSFRIPRKNSS